MIDRYNSDILYDYGDGVRREKELKREKDLPQDKFNRTRIKACTEDRVVIETNPHNQEGRNRYEFSREDNKLISYEPVTSHVLDYISVHFKREAVVLSRDQQRLSSIDNTTSEAPA
jgi:hypothetical protein